jgi:hypothetical protein
VEAGLRCERYAQLFTSYQYKVLGGMARRILKKDPMPHQTYDFAFRAEARTSRRPWILEVLDDSVKSATKWADALNVVYGLGPRTRSHV